MRVHTRRRRTRRVCVWVCVFLRAFFVCVARSEEVGVCVGSAPVWGKAVAASHATPPAPPPLQR
eukprot:scaffold32633_cov36-Phaeocystis_antarctica.AAC.2